jgi:hypothetical protein
VTDRQGIVDQLPDPEPRAFVLRTRVHVSEGPRRWVFDLEDVKAAESWRFTSLDEAFAKIRAVLGLQPGADHATGKPH